MTWSACLGRIRGFQRGRGKFKAFRLIYFPGLVNFFHGFVSVNDGYLILPNHLPCVGRFCVLVAEMRRKCITVIVTCENQMLKGKIQDVFCPFYQSYSQTSCVLMVSNLPIVEIAERQQRPPSSAVSFLAVDVNPSTLYNSTGGLIIDVDAGEPILSNGQKYPGTLPATIVVVSSRPISL